MGFDGLSNRIGDNQGYAVCPCAIDMRGILQSATLSISELPIVAVRWDSLARCAIECLRPPGPSVDSFDTRRERQVNVDVDAPRRGHPSPICGDDCCSVNASRIVVRRILGIA